MDNHLQICGVAVAILVVLIGAVKLISHSRSNSIHNARSGQGVVS